MEEIWQDVNVCGDQSYRWRKVENKFGKVKKYAEIEYFWHGDMWRRVIESMKSIGMRPVTINYYKGTQIDEANGIIKMRGDFIREIAADRHRFFWRRFFNMTGKDDEPVFKSIGKLIKLPNISGDNDSLRFLINGDDVNSILTEPQEADGI